MANTSLKQIEANRNNALKSTGPKTLSGKHKASRNALKHGILSPVVVAHHANESEADFNQLLTDLCKDFQPNGTMESILVERIAVCVWRLRRTLLVESAAIGKGFMDATIQSSAVPTQADIRQKILAVSTVDGYAQVTKYERDKVRWKLEALQELLSGISARNKVTDREIERFRVYLSEREEADLLDDGYQRDLKIVQALNAYSDFDDSWEEVSALMEAEDSDFDEDYEPWTQETWEATQHKYWTEALATLDEGIKHYQLLVSLMERERNATLNARLHQPFLLSEDTLNRITRYETMLERQLYRAIQELERLQKRRRGEVQAWLFFAFFAKRTQIEGQS